MNVTCQYEKEKDAFVEYNIAEKYGGVFRRIIMTLFCILPYN